MVYGLDRYWYAVLKPSIAFIITNFCTVCLRVCLSQTLSFFNHRDEDSKHRREIEVDENSLGLMSILPNTSLCDKGGLEMTEGNYSGCST